MTNDEAERVGAVKITRQWIHQRIFYRLASLFGLYQLEIMLRNALQRYRGHSSDCKVRVAPNGFSIWVALICLLSARLCTRLGCFDTLTSPLTKHGNMAAFYRDEDKATPKRMTSTDDCLRVLKARWHMHEFVWLPRRWWLVSRHLK